jgi:hypothetical protein
MGDWLPGDGTDLGRSGESFPLGNLLVVAEFGYSEDGDRLQYMVIRAYPATSTAQERLADPRCDFSSGCLPRLRHADGTMRRVETDGQVYLFIGDELRVMRVSMNEHTDMLGLRRAASLEGMWEYMRRFCVPELRHKDGPGEL